MSLTSSIYDHFILCPSSVTLTFNLLKRHFSFLKTTTVQNYFEIHASKYKLWPGQAQFMTILTFIWPLWSWPSSYLKKNVLNGTSPPQRQQLCKIILKSMQKCTSYGPDKLNLWPFWHLFDRCDLDLQRIRKNGSNGTSPPQNNNCAKLFLKCMHKYTSSGPDKLNIWPFWPLFDPCDLDLHPTWKNVSNGTCLPWGQ